MTGVVFAITIGINRSQDCMRPIIDIPVETPSLASIDTVKLFDVVIIATFH